MFVVTINVDYFNKILSADNPADVAIQLFFSGGWLVFVFVIIWGVFHIWIEARQDQYDTAQKKVLLAIDVPKDTEQSPKAAEFIFHTISGALSVFDRIEKYWYGKVQPVFGFEIVSIGGYIQFYVRTWVKYRDVVEAAIYAQYPDAEITEVEDYVNNVPKKFPAPDWDLFGMEFKLYNKNYYPIRTYPEFEHPLSGELKDPLAALLEGLSKMRPGEQLWLQLLISPMVNDEWKKEGFELAKKLIGRKDSKNKITFRGEIGKLPGSMIEAALMADAQPLEKKDEMPSMMLHLTPGERAVVEGIDRKMTKEPFRAKYRLIYVGKKEGFAKARTVALIKGVFSQFTILDSNGLRPYPKVSTRSDYPWQRRKIFEYLSLFIIRTFSTRQNAILRAYRGRSMSTGAPASIFNVEELATLYHFPVVQVKAPLVKKILTKRAEPPVHLPISTQTSYQETPFVPKAAFQTVRAKAAPPREVLEQSWSAIPTDSSNESTESVPPGNLPVV